MDKLCSFAAHMKYLLFILLTLFCTHTFAQTNKQAFATRLPANQSIKLDANLNDAAWSEAQVISDFTQYDPQFNQAPRYKTEVRILYDDQALYVGARLFDPRPDSILTQLGNRDDELNSDYFQIAFDTYNRQQDAFFFKVYASGVQADFREKDHTFNAIWYSKVKIDEQGWVVELRIPYSAIRFSEGQNQLWGLQIERSTRRYREISHWALQELASDNYQSYWGTLAGIKDIKSPLRLSLMPYISTAAVFENGDWGSDFNGGMDLKYGINESFTLDMILLPDFSQVQSDRQIKNLSAFEVRFTEQRQFFQESTDLFEKGDLFYSRRIGRRPAAYYSVYDSLQADEELIFNPNSAALLNATKISGRFDNGLAIGVFNAVTNGMYAEAEDSLGNTRSIQTEPLTNYSIVVFDKALKNNSSVYFINTNTSRQGDWKNSNVSGLGTKLIDKTSTWQVKVDLASSFKESRLNALTDSLSNDMGYKIGGELRKIKGRFQFGYVHNTKSDNWDINDLGILFVNNEANNHAYIAYKIVKPWWKLRRVNFQFNLSEKHNITTQQFSDARFSFNSFGLTLNYFAFWYGFHYNLTESYNYYEPRTAGRVFIEQPSMGGYLGYSSDYRKRIALDGNINYYVRNNERDMYFEFNPIVRVSDKFSFDYTFQIDKSYNDKGFSGRSTDSIFFGQRDVQVIENALNGRYMFKNNLSLGLAVRHYWSVGVYNAYFLLQNDGYLQQLENASFNRDFNFNAFNIDVNFSWQFAPGSMLNFNYKNEIVAENDKTEHDYFWNFSNTFKEDQLSRFSLKLVYYLDYQTLRRS
jgi:hypothetical protein